MEKTTNEKMIEAVKNKDSVTFEKLFESAMNEGVGAALNEKQKDMANNQAPDQADGENGGSEPGKTDKDAAPADDEGEEKETPEKMPKKGDKKDEE